MTIVAASIPILRALARDRGPGAGQRLTFNATLSWTRLRVSRTRNSTENGDHESRNIPRDDIQEHHRYDQRQETSESDWYNGGRRLKPLSRITETDEIVSETGSPKAETISL